MAEILGLFAGIIGLVGYIPYIRDTVSRSTKPDRISWLIWAFEYTVLFLAQAAQHATGSLWLVGLQLLGVLIVSVLSLRYGVGGIDKRKGLLIVCVCIAMALWYFTKDPSIATYILLLVEVTGVILTAIKVYREPGSETLTMWVLTGVAGALGVPAVGQGAPIALYAYPIALVLMCSCVVGANFLAEHKTNTLAFVEEPEDDWKHMLDDGAI